MATTTVRISAEAHNRLRRLAAQEGTSMSQLLDEAVDILSRQRYFDHFNDAYRRLREDEAAWKKEEADRSAWDGTLLDGLEDNAYEE